eukprot:1181405-Prorocentrum_minimum.AAC.3
MRNNRTARPRDESSPQGGSPRRIVAPGRLTETNRRPRAAHRDESSPQGGSHWRLRRKAF